MISKVKSNVGLQKADSKLEEQEIDYDKRNDVEICAVLKCAVCVYCVLQAKPFAVHITRERDPITHCFECFDVTRHSILFHSAR